MSLSVALRLPAPPVVDLGVAIGLLEPGSTASEAQVRFEWFDDPIGEVRGAVADEQRRAAILRAAMATLQALPDRALPGGGSEWLRIADDIPLDLVLREVDGGLAVGVAYQGEWSLDGNGLAVTVEGTVLHAGPGGVAVAGTEEFDDLDGGDFPFLKASVSLTLVGDGPIDAVALSASLALEDVQAELTVTVDGVPVRVDLDDDALGGSLEVVRTLLWALADRLSTSPEVRRLRDHLFGLFGWNPRDPSVPPLDLLALLADARTELQRWIAAIAADAARLRAWLRQVLGLFWGGDLGTLPDVGDEACVSLVPAGNPGDPRLTLCAEVLDGDGGARRVAVFLAASAWAALDATRRLQASARLGLFSVTIEGPPVIEAPLGMELLLELFAPGGGPVLAADLSLQADADLAALGSFSLGSAEAGLTWDADGPSPRLVLRDVHAAGSVHARLDLSTLDALLEAAAGGLRDALRDALRALLGDAPHAARLAALLGFPDPALFPTLPAIDLSVLVADPAEAWENWLSALLDESGGPRPIGDWLQELRNLFTIDLGATLPPLTGEGTEASPWLLTLVPGAPALRLGFWVTEPATDRRCLQIALVVDPAPTILGAGLALDTLLTVRLASLCVPTPGAAGDLEAELLPGVSFVAVLGTNLRVDLPEGWAVTADRLVFRLDQERGKDPRPDLQVVDLALVEGTLPRISLPRLDLGSIGWDPSAGDDWPRLLLRLLELAFDLPSFEALGPGPDFGQLVLDPWKALWSWLAGLFSNLGGLGPIRMPALELLGRWARGVLDLPELPGAPGVLGGGTYEDPWRVVLADPGHPVELLAWVDPDGPTAANLAAQVDRWLPAFPPAVDLAADRLYLALLAAGQHLPTLAGALEAMGQANFTASLERLEDLLATHPAGADGAAAFLAEAQRLAASLATPAVLITAPGQSPDDWLIVRAGLQAAGRAVHELDLRATTAATPAELIAALATALDALGLGSPPLLLSHGLGGAAVRGLVSGSGVAAAACVVGGDLPTGSVPLVPGRGPEADLLRLLALAPADIWDDAGLAGALQRLLELVADGWAGPGLPRAVHALEAAVASDLAGLVGPANVALSSLSAIVAAPTSATGIRARIVRAVRAWLLQTLGGAGRRPMTHVGFGVRGGVLLGGSPDVEADVRARFDLLTLRLPGVADTVEPEHPTPAVHVEVDLRRPGGWLVGSPTSDPRLRWMEAALRWNLAEGWAPSAVLHDAAFHGLGLPTARPGDGCFDPLLDALSTEVLRPGTPLGPLLDLLVGLGLLSGDDTTGWQVLARPLEDFLADAGGRLLARFAAVPGPGVMLGPLGPGLLALAFVEIPEGWRLDLEGGWSFTVRRDGCLALVAPSSGPLEGTLEVNPFVAGGDVALSMSLTPPGLGLTLQIGWTPSGGLSALLVAAEGSFAGSLLPAPVDLGAPPADFGPLVVEVAGRLALEHLAGRIALGLLVPALPATVVAVLEALGVLVRDSGGDLAVGPLLRIVDDPARYFLDPTRLAAAAGTLPLGSLGALALEVAAGVAVARFSVGSVLLASSAAGDLVLAYDLSLRLLPTPDVAASAALTLPLGGGASITVQVGVGAGAFSLSFVVRSSPSDPAPVVLRLAPTLSGFDSLAAASARKLVPLAIEALLKLLHDEGGSAAAVGDALETLLVGLGAGVLFEGRFRFDGDTLAVLLDDPLARFTGPGAGLSALQHLLTALNTLFGQAGFASGSTVPVSGTPGRLTLPLNPALPGSGTLPLDLVVGVEGTAPNLRLGAWLELRPSGWPGSAVVRPDGPTRLGMLWSATAGVSPRLEVALRVDAPGFPFAPTLFVSDAAGLTLRIGLDSPWTTDDLVLTLLPTFSAAGADPLTLLRAYAVPLLLEALRAHPVLDLPIGGIASLRLGTALEDAGLLVESGGQRILAPGPPTAWQAAGGALKTALRAIDQDGPAPIKDYVYYDDARAEAGVEIPAIDDLEVLSDPKIAILFGLAGQSWSVRIPLLDLSDGVEFRVGFRLAGLGIRVAGAGEAPLLETDVLVLGSLGAGLLLDVEPGGGLPDGSPSYVHGAFVEVSDLRLPLGQGGGGGVAGSLLPDTADSPGFDLRVAWSKGDLSLSFPDAPEKPEFWWEIDREFGPLDVQRLGVRVLPADPSVALLLDATFGLAGLEVTVDDFGVELPLRTIHRPDTWELTLGGLGVHFEQEGIVISGALRRKDPNTYAGAAIVKLFDFELSAIGEYSKKPDYTSLFVFAKLGAPLGGPPAFFVTGIAAGFGYNRAFEVPADLGRLAQHPLLGVMSGAMSTSEALDRVDTALPARRGSHWVAAGVTFTSFVFIEGQALAYVLIDDAVTIGLIGKAGFELPMGLPLLSVELAIEAAIRIGPDPFVMVRAQLTDNSWLLSRDCKLTGGFAFAAWFERGDSVLTIGGYHPAFRKPSHYPDVPRVGFRWQVGGGIVAKGGIYFALTPREVMGGASVHVSGKWGPARAWLDVGIDGLLGWDPFYYDFSFRAEVGVEVDLWLFSFGGSVGVRVRIRGPKFGGRATVSVGPVDFTIRFGADDAPRKEKLPLHTFVKGHLGASQATASGGRVVAPGLTEVEVVEGNAAEGQDADETPLRLGIEFRLRVRTKIPASQVRYKPVGVMPGGRGGRQLTPTWQVVHDSGAMKPLDFHEDVDFVPSQVADVESTLAVRFVPRANQHGSTPSFVKTRALRSQLPKAQFRMGTQMEDGLYLPETTGEPTVALLDRLELHAETQMIPAAPQVVEPKPQRSDRPHPLPLTCGGELPGVADWSEWREDALALDLTLLTVEPEALFAATRGWTAARARRLRSYAVAPRVGTLVAGFGDVRSVSERAHVGWAPPGTRDSEWQEPMLRLQPEVVAIATQGTTTVGPAARTLARTTVDGIRGVERAPRVAAPTVGKVPPWLARAALVQVSLPGASRPAGGGITVLARSESLPASQARFLDAASKELLRKGTRLHPGMAELISFGVEGGRLPDERLRLGLSGTQALRVVFLGRGDRVVGDDELPPGKHAIDVPAGSARAWVVGLGAPDKAKGRFAESVVRSHATRRPITLSQARRSQVTVGFDEDSLLLRLGARLYLGRGCLVRTVQGEAPTRRVVDGVRGRALLGVSDAVSVDLPAGRSTLAVLVRPMAGLDLAAEVKRERMGLRVDPSAVMEASDGVKLGRVITLLRPDGVLLLRDVLAEDDWTVTVRRGAKRRLGGIALLPGDARSQAKVLDAQERWDLVEDGPLTAKGSSLVRLEERR